MLHQGLVLVWLEVQVVKVLFLWVKGKTQPWLGAGPPIVVHLAAETAGGTVLEAAVGTGGGVTAVGVAVELSEDAGAGERVELVGA